MAFIFYILQSRKCTYTSTAEMYAYAQDSIVLKMFTLLLATNKCIEDSRDRHGLQYKCMQ